jgi:hypothetical protein
MRYLLPRRKTQAPVVVGLVVCVVGLVVQPGQVKGHYILRFVTHLVSCFLLGQTARHKDGSNEVIIFRQSEQDFCRTLIPYT